MAWMFSTAALTSWGELQAEEDEALVVLCDEGPGFFKRFCCKKISFLKYCYKSLNNKKASLFYLQNIIIFAYLISDATGQSVLIFWTPDYTKNNLIHLEYTMLH